MDEVEHMTQTALSDYEAGRLAWPHEEIVEALHGARCTMTTGDLWRTIPIPVVLMIKGKRGRPPRRPAPVSEFFEALRHLAHGNVITADGRDRWQIDTSDGRTMGRLAGGMT